MCKMKFKQGDEVIIKGSNLRGQVKYILFSGSRPVYHVSYWDDKLGRTCVHSKYSYQLYPVNEPNIKTENQNNTETRSVQLTLTEAREWYKKGGDLREVALMVFSEKELKQCGYPKTWDEYCKLQRDDKANGYSGSGYGTCTVNWESCYTYDMWKNVLPTIELRDKIFAYIQLLSLRYKWLQIWSEQRGLDEVWNDAAGYTICPEYPREEHVCLNISFTTRSLSFPTKELANDFMDCFKDLLEQAKGLY